MKKNPAATEHANVKRSNAKNVSTSPFLTLFRTLAVSTTVLTLLLPEFHQVAWGQSYDRHELQVGSHIHVGDLAGAIFSIPVVGDFDGDGTPDLIVATQHQGQGVRFYQGHDTSAGKRIFEPGIDVALPITSMVGVDWNRDSLTDILLLDSGASSGAGNKNISVSVCRAGTPPVFESPRALQNTESCESLASARSLSARAYGEFIDVVLGEADFRDYWPGRNDLSLEKIGFWKGYDSTGRWRGRERLAFITRLRLTRDSKSSVDQNGVLLMGQYAPLAGQFSTSPIIIDADGDGRDDIIYSDFVGNFYFAKSRPQGQSTGYEDPVTLYLENGQRLRSPQCIVRGFAVNWNADRLEDIVFGSEDSFVYLSLNVGIRSGKPAFLPPVRVQQKRPPLDFGVAAVPAPCDIDGDGDTDLVVGNASGEILIAYNKGTNDRPAFSLPISCEVDGRPFRIEAGYRGSIQGPMEARWGYAGVSTADVDGDGDIDLLFSSVNGYHQGLLNIGDASQPKWARATYIQSDEKRYRSVWRTRPLKMDWDDDGQLDYICQNQRGEIGIFLGAPDRAWNQLDDWTAWRFENGETIDTDADNGMEGRAKIAIADWDGDGMNDLLVGVKGGGPWATQQGRKSLSYVFFLKGIQKGRNAVFAKPRAIRFANGQDIEVGDHTASPETAMFFGDTKPGLLLGIENGRVHYYSQDELRW